MLTKLDHLTATELEILALMAEGWSNRGICERIWRSPKTVESHIRTIFIKLGLTPSDAANRRVLAVRTYLDSSLSARSASQV